MNNFPGEDSRDNCKVMLVPETAFSAEQEEKKPKKKATYKELDLSSSVTSLAPNINHSM